MFTAYFVNMQRIVTYKEDGADGNKYNCRNNTTWLYDTIFT
jgi:hypothetical protein